MSRSPWLQSVAQRHAFRTVACPVCAKPVIRLTRPFRSTAAVCDADSVDPTDQTYNHRRHKLHFRTCRKPLEAA